MRIVLPIIAIVLCVLLQLQSHVTTARAAGAFAQDDSRRTHGFLASVLYGDLTELEWEVATGYFDVEATAKFVAQPLPEFASLNAVE